MTLLVRVLEVMESNNPGQPILEEIRAAVERQDELQKILVGLSPGQMDVAIFLGRGYSNKEIAESLKLDERTIGTVKCNIRRKLGVDNDAQIIVALWQAGMVGDCDV